MRLMAIDPGPSESAVVVIGETGNVIQHYKRDNPIVLEEVRAFSKQVGIHIVCEMIASYGKSVGQETFETCVWVGRYIESTSGDLTRMYRKEVCKQLCGSASGVKDSVIRQRMIDIYSQGRGELVAVGRKKTPGPLYGFSADQWQALGLAVAFAELKLGWRIER